MCNDLRACSGLILEKRIFSSPQAPASLYFQTAEQYKAISTGPLSSGSARVTGRRGV